ncbi:MAG: uroporphyrinogen decarboxylase family protein [candidate division KSB1 bacterium]|jgi:hypothetical protein|nr:uroporphyrinogen decarboxylase family protein [candidate division KSB1 bacterium]
MTSRERVRRAIHLQGPDRIPHYLPVGGENDILWAAPWTIVNGPLVPDIQPWMQTGLIEKRIDAWGVVWDRPAGHEDMGQAKEYPISDIEKQHLYTFPKLNDPERYAGYRNAIEANDSAGNPKYVLGVAGFSSLNEAVHNIIGLQTMFQSYYEHPDALKALIARFAEQQRESIRLMARLGCDGVMFYDDWGLQDRLMIRPNLIEEFFIPHYRVNWAVAHELDLDVWLHSCGYIIGLLPQFMDAGLNVVQMDQQMNMGLENLAHVAGSRLAFWCPADIQNVLPNAAEDAIYAYIQSMMDTLGSRKGGLVSMAYSSPEAIDLDPEKVRIMCQAFRELGMYD